MGEQLSIFQQAELQLKQNTVVNVENSVYGPSFFHRPLCGRKNFALNPAFHRFSICKIKPVEKPPAQKTKIHGSGMAAEGFGRVFHCFFTLSTGFSTKKLRFCGRFPGLPPAAAATRTCVCRQFCFLPPCPAGAAAGVGGNFFAAAAAPSRMAPRKMVEIRRAAW